MSHRVLSLLAAAVVIVTQLSAAPRRRAAVPPPAPQLSPAEQWFRTAAIPFVTTEARTGHSDLEPLREIVGNSRIVALGEATHGTREFFTMKHRMLEYLVEEMGFTVFAIEANLPEADRVDDYVVNGVGDPGAALAGMYFWTWNTTEVLDLILWAREYNLRRGDKPPVRFRGFDNQFAQVAAPKVEAYLARVDPAGAAEVSRLYDCFRPFTMEAFKKLDTAARTACTANMERAHATLAEKRADYTARSSAVELENHLRYARVVVQAAEIWVRGPMVRDGYMAENAQWLADTAHPDEKIVLWAHNTHVATWPNFMGSFLKQRYGSDYVIFGFAFEHGTFNAVARGGSLGKLRIERDSAPAGGWEPLFRGVGRPRFFLDLRDVPADIAPSVADPLTLWTVGSMFDPNMPTSGRGPTPIFQRYDVMIYIESTTASTLIR